MAIKSYIYNKSVKSDRDLYAWIGHWLLDSNFYKELGVCITSQEGDLWLVITPQKGKSRGFSVTRDTKTTNSRHIRFLYADTDILKETLINRIIREATDAGINLIWTNELIDYPLLKDNGFIKKGKARGRFIRWELKIERKSDD